MGLQKIKTDNNLLCRPLPLLLGVLRKLQDNLDSFPGTPEVEPAGLDHQEDVLSMLGHFWHLIKAADTSIRYTDQEDQEQEQEEEQEEGQREGLGAIRRRYASMLGIPEEQVVWIWSSRIEKKSRLSDYVPEHLITIDHRHRSLILTILGTKVFPFPQPLDIMMDLLGTGQTFLDGVAHGGMSIGTRNLVETAVPVLRRELLVHPSYTLLVLGYSLGAGLAQLLSLDCSQGPCSHSLPHNTNIRTVAFGSPPVFSRQGGEDPPALENVFIVQNGRDGIGGASLANIYDLLNRACLLHNMNIKRRTLLRLLFSDVDIEEDRDLIDFEDDEDDSEKIEHDRSEDEENSLITATWRKIKESLHNYSSQVDEPKLHHLGGTFLVLTKTDDNTIEAQNYQGFEGTEKFSRELTLQPSMISDHMPNAYDSLFEDYQDFNKTNKILNYQLLDNLVPRKREGFRDKLKKKFKKIKSKVLGLFKGIGK